MTVFKCKMCGGTLEIQNNASVAICEYCGTQQTLPKLDSDRKANMYDRANYFRRNNEFDAAMAIYEQILAEDNTDAESYWSLVLCRYGIEYVEDPNSHKRIPTVNRAQFTSIFADADYKNAIKNADSLQKKVYEQEAKTIDEIQKGILAISEKEEPFDVFICYKETDSLGRRTVDSVIAMDIYKELTKEGYKVFFSRVTLEDKLGQEYEPYIFAALNSAKAMIVLGTKTEYFDAVWVKNEWSRYLSLIKNGEKKTLIPAYRDISPYDLPKEFAYLQAQDMGKIGFMQDLVYGIQKIIPLDKNKSTAMPMADATGNLTPLFLTNASVALSNGDFQGANQYCNEILKNDSKNAQAYLYKLMAELFVRKEEDLAKYAVPFDKNENYKKAVQYGDKTLTLRLQSYIDQINEHIKKQKKAQKRMTKIGIIAASSVAVIALAVVATVNLIIPGVKYSKANGLFDEGRYEEAISAFEALEGFGNSEKRILDCKFEMAMDLVEAGKFDEAIKAFEALGNFNGSDHHASEVQNKIDAQIAEAEAQKEAQRIAMLDEMYEKALSLMNSEEDSKTLDILTALNGYKDSETLINQIQEKYRLTAEEFISAGKYAEAKACFAVYNDKKMMDACQAAIEGRYGDAVILGLSEFVVPDGVTAITSKEFSYCKELVSITLPEGLISIANSAFSGCSNLVKINLPSSLISIGSKAFYGCSKLKDVELPENLTTLGDSAFYQCASLISVEIPSGITVIGQELFYKCTGLQSVKLPTGITKINSSAFYGCTGLQRIELPEKITIIGSYAFKECINLLNIDIPKTITEIGSYAFGGCSSLQNVEIPAGIKVINAGVFEDCTRLEGINLPSGLKSIAGNAFKDCSNLQNIIIPSTVTNMGSSIFKGCSSLQNIEIPSGITMISSYMFEDCTDLRSVKFKNITSIGDYAFRGCSNLKSITIPKTLTSVGIAAFAKCTALIDFYYEDSKVDWYSIRRGSGSFSNLPSYTVHCTDGDIVG